MFSNPVPELLTQRPAICCIARSATELAWHSNKHVAYVCELHICYACTAVEFLQDQGCVPQPSSSATHPPRTVVLGSEKRIAPKLQLALWLEGQSVTVIIPCCVMLVVPAMSCLQ